jgi:diacylglycerol O-acyltransferase 2, plant
VPIGLYIHTVYQDDCHLKLGRAWHWLQEHSMWTLCHHFGQIEIVREAELDPKRQYIFGIYPHGILILSRIALFGGILTTLFPGISFLSLAARAMFNIPGCRELSLWLGGIDANRKTAKYALEHGKSLIIYPGGTREIFQTDPNSSETVLIIRDGFIKLAIEHGCDLLPCFVFGEKWMYDRLSVPQKIQNYFMARLRVPVLLFWGQWGTWMPKKNTFLSMVFGRPIRVEKMLNPTAADIERLQR